MPLIDVTSGLTGPLPWVPGVPLAARVVVLVASFSLAALSVVVARRRAKDER